jgi:hypothetical protein
MSSRRCSPLALAALLLGACDILDSRDVICTDSFLSGLEVTVEDSLTGAPSASGAQLIAQDGAYADTVSYAPNRPDLDAQPLRSAGERPGTYTVSVRKPGFFEWVRSGIVVTADECHVRPVALTARLQRTP